MRDIYPNIPVIRPEYFASSTPGRAMLNARVATAIIRFLANGMRAKEYTAFLHSEFQRLFPFERMDRKAFKERFLSSARSRFTLVMKLGTYMPIGDADTLPLNRLIRNYVVQHLVGRWPDTFIRAEATKERAMLISLLKKYGLPEQFRMPGGYS